MITKKIVVSISVLITLLFLIGIFFLNKKDNLPPLSSKQNLDLMSEALKKKDSEICNQIRGGIEASKQPKLKGLDVFMQPTPAMTESEAKEECKKDVQRAIERQNE